MQMANPSFLLVGLENGGLAGWDLGANRVDNLPAHAGPNSSISHLQKFMTLLFTGDNGGRIQVRSIENGYQPLMAEITTMIQAPITDI